MKLAFKTDHVHREFFSDEVHRDVKFLVLMLAAFIESRFGAETEITSILPEDNVKRVSGTHEDGRAIDAVARKLSRGAAEAAARWMNDNFSTGVSFPDGRPMEVCVYHDAGYGVHFHLQVPRGRPIKIKTEHFGDLLI